MEFWRMGRLRLSTLTRTLSLSGSTLEVCGWVEVGCKKLVVVVALFGGFFLESADWGRGRQLGQNWDFNMITDLFWCPCGHASKASNPRSWRRANQRFPIHFSSSSHVCSTWTRICEVAGSSGALTSVGCGRSRIADTRVWYKEAAKRKHTSDSLHNASSIVFLAPNIISLEISPQGSMTIPNLLNPCSAANKNGKLFSGVVRLARPRIVSRVFEGKAENSWWTQPSPKTSRSAF